LGISYRTIRRWFKAGKASGYQADNHCHRSYSRGYCFYLLAGGYLIAVIVKEI
jgi:hypothetical protein